MNVITRDSRPLITILAPKHVPFDERVLRTVEIAAEFGTALYYYDPNSAGMAADLVTLSGRLQSAGSHTVQLLPLPLRKGRGYCNRRVWVKQVGSLLSDLKTDVVHIHDSATLGLEIAWMLHRLNRDHRPKIIWDYHDWLPYEVATRVNNQRALYRVFLPFAEVICKHWARAVDVVVGISPGQLNYARRILRIPRGVCVQNIRPHENMGSSDLSKENAHRLIWMGHVMRIRNIGFLLEVVREISSRYPDAQMHIWGAIIDRDFAEELRERIQQFGLGQRVCFKGPYKSDSDVRGSLASGAIGMVPGWDDPLRTGINAIASTNKFFSYLSLGLPVLLEDGLDNMVELAVSAGAGLTYQPIPKSCAQIIERIWEDNELWYGMRQGSLELSSRMHGEQAKDTLRDLYTDLLA